MLYFACNIHHESGITFTALQEFREECAQHELEESLRFPETRCACCQHEDPAQHLSDGLCEDCKPSDDWGHRPAPNSVVEVDCAEIPEYSDRVWGHETNA